MIAALCRALIDAALFFIPRFITDNVAVELQPSGVYDLVGPMESISEEERYDGYVKITVLVFMFWGFPAKKWGNSIEYVHPWPSDRSKL